MTAARTRRATRADDAPGEAEEGPSLPVYRVVVANWLPTSLNRIIGHWSKAHAIKTRDAAILARAFTLAGLPKVRVPADVAKARKKVGLPRDQHWDPKPIRRRVSLEVTLPKGKRANDGDNLLKSLLDGMKRGGFLVDDGPKWCEPILPPLYHRGEAAETVIVVQDLPYLKVVAKPRKKGGDDHES